MQLFVSLQVAIAKFSFLANFFGILKLLFGSAGVMCI